MAAPKRGLGWVPDLPDQRDQYLAAHFGEDELRGLAKKVDLRPRMPAVYNQGSLGSCTAQGVAALLQFTEAEVFGGLDIPSRLFIYYNTRILQGTLGEDSGASIRNAIKAVVKEGYCQEKLWPYDVTKFKRKPPAAAYKAGDQRLITAYARVQQQAAAIKQRLAGGDPIVFGFSVYENFDETAKTGVCPMPKGAVTGGHAVVLCGYDDRRKMFLVRNSWGARWGDKGYYWKPYDMVLNPDIAADFWTIWSVPTP